MAYFETKVLDNQIKALPTIKAISNTPIASFDTDIADRLVSCVCEVASGKSEVNVTRCGKNLVDQTQFVQGSISGTGADTVSYTRLRSPFIFVKPNTSYAFGTNSTLLVFEIHEYKSDNTWIQYTGINQTSGTITTTANTAYIKILVRNSTNTPLTVDELSTFQMEFGYTPTTYTAFVANNTYNIQLGETLSDTAIYNAVTGVLTRSDDTTKQLDGCPIVTIANSENNIWADTGDIIDLKFVLSLGQAIS